LNKFGNIVSKNFNLHQKNLIKSRIKIVSRTVEQTISNRLVLGKSILSEANLGEKVEIRIQNRSIMILPTIEKKGWNILKELGENAA